MRKTPLLLAMACLLLVGVPAASADVVILRFDGSGDRDCDDPGETIAIPGPVHEHHLVACLVLS